MFNPKKKEPGMQGSNYNFLNIILSYEKNFLCRIPVSNWTNLFSYAKIQQNLNTGK